MMERIGCFMAAKECGLLSLSSCRVVDDSSSYVERDAGISSNLKWAVMSDREAVIFASQRFNDDVLFK